MYLDYMHIMPIKEEGERENSLQVTQLCWDKILMIMIIIYTLYKNDKTYIPLRVHGLG